MKNIESNKKNAEAGTRYWECEIDQLVYKL